MKRKVAGAKSTPPAELDTGAMPRLSKFQAFTPRRVARRDLKNAPYNPRTITDEARAKLTTILEKGLVESITWNKRSGNIVGGHQRIEILDALEGTQDYSLDVCEIDVDEKREIELNLALNHPGAQGQFVAEKVRSLLETDGLDFDAAGIDAMDMQVIFQQDLDVVERLFAEENIPDEAKADLDELGALSKKKRGDKKKPEETPEQRIERMRREKKEHREAARERDDTEFYVVAVFADCGARERFLKRIGADVNERYLDGRVLERLVSQTKH